MRKFTALLAAAALAAGCAASTDAEPEEAVVAIEHAAEAEPEVIVETVVEEVEVIKEVEVEVEVTPRACIAALDAAEDLMGNAAAFATIVSEYPGLVADAMNAGMDMDVAAAERILRRIESITAEVNALSDGIEGNSFPRHAAECRQAAR